MDTTLHRPLAELEHGLATIAASPRESGTLVLIARRPAVDQREVLEVAELDVRSGLVGDNWLQRRSSRTPDGAPHPDMQLNVMNARAIALLAGPRERWALAGDQLYLDFDLSPAGCPAGTRLQIGGAIIEITAQPHTGCKKFAARFGEDALRFVNSEVGKLQCRRGRNAKVVQTGTIRRGDVVRRI